MPFEPLKTDERLPSATPRERSMDDAMLAGCTGFVASSVIAYFLAVWPFLLTVEATRWQDILRALALGLIPSALFGAYVSRRHGLAAACGFIGGVLATAVFLHLNIRRILVAVVAQRGDQLDFPPVMVYLIPLAWVLVALIVSLSLVRKSEWAPSEPPSQQAP